MPRFIVLFEGVRVMSSSDSYSYSDQVIVDARNEERAIEAAKEKLGIIPNEDDPGEAVNVPFDVDDPDEYMVFYGDDLSIEVKLFTEWFEEKLVR